jgi:bifunctional UDP-N-acetylglucosamine pyrophosphorylase/glucosamine-1-phosphate N-acetyltransferase
MQAVILVAGKGTRMRPLTDELPKPLVQVAGKPLIEHVLSFLPEDIDEVILVLGYKGHMIEDHLGKQHNGKSIRYVWQHEQKGTAHALEQAKDLLHDSFLLMYGDDIVDKESIARALQYPSCLLAYEHEDPRAFGVIVQNEDGTLRTIMEKPENPPSNLVSAAGIVLHTNLFKYFTDWQEGKEMCIPDALDRYAKDYPVYIERLEMWHPVNSIEQLLLAEKHLSRE